MEMGAAGVLKTLMLLVEFWRIFGKDLREDEVYSYR